MKILILSDIHSNIYALEAIWAQENDSDLIYCTGDLVDIVTFVTKYYYWLVKEIRYFANFGLRQIMQLLAF